MKIAFLRIDHVQICIPKGQEAVARQFYCDILQLEEIEKPEYLKKNGGFWLLIGDIQLHIGVEEPHCVSKRHPAFVVADLDGAKAHLLAHEVPIKEDPPIPGYRRFSFYDPFQNRIELLAFTTE